MELYPKQKSDAEYIAMTRKTIKRSRWFLLLYGVAFVFFNAMFLTFWNWIHNLPETMPEFAEGSGPGFFIGTQLGAMAGVMVLCAVITVIFAIPCMNGFRTEKLMLKFHDELKKQESSNQKVDPIN